MEFLKKYWHVIGIICIGIIAINVFSSSDSSSADADYRYHNEPDYVCGSNTYNCSDFSSHREAQSVLDGCRGDVHRLDRDNDGIACESLLD
jgi:hypothetical protein